MDEPKTSETPVNEAQPKDAPDTAAKDTQAVDAPKVTKSSEASEAKPKRISIDKFFETDLRVAQVLEAERIEGTDKLLQLKIDVGEEAPRQLVAGIALAYEAADLIGKKIIIVANLKPAKIRGVKSQGMLLAGNLDGKPFVATFDEDVPVGTRVG